jgi:hypothetical protein
MSDEIHRVTIILSNPSSREPTGRVSYGFYKVENNKVILTDAEGTPVRRATGDVVAHKLKDGEEAHHRAWLMAREFRRHIHGDRKDGFTGPIVYPPGKFWH